MYPARYPTTKETKTMSHVVIIGLRVPPLRSGVSALFDPLKRIELVGLLTSA